MFPYKPPPTYHHKLFSLFQDTHPVGKTIIVLTRKVLQSSPSENSNTKAFIFLRLVKVQFHWKTVKLSICITWLSRQCVSCTNEHKIKFLSKVSLRNCTHDRLLPSVLALMVFLLLVVLIITAWITTNRSSSASSPLGILAGIWEAVLVMVRTVLKLKMLSSRLGSIWIAISLVVTSWRCMEKGMFGAPLNVVVSAVSLLCFDSFGQSEEYEMKTEHSVYYELLLFTPLSILLFSSLLFSSLLFS